MQVGSRERVSETEEKIFESALAVFSQKGLDGTRMHEIASHAEINPALLHYYFGHKEDLYDAVLRYAIHSYMSSISEVMEGADTFESTLRRFIDGYVDYGMQNRDVLRLVMAENLSGGKRLGAIFREIKESPHAPPRKLIATIRDAIKRGEIRSVEPEHATLTIISSCLHFVLVYPMLEMIYPHAAERPRFIEERKRHIFDLIYHGFAA